MGRYQENEYGRMILKNSYTFNLMYKATKPTHETDYGYNLTTVANNSFELRTKSQTFLMEEKDFGKVHQGREAEDNRSLHQILQISHPGLKELGYPNERHTLAIWYREYE